MRTTAAAPLRAQRLPAAALSLGGLVFAWAVAARLTGDPAVLPSPLRVWEIAVAQAQSGALWRHVSATLARVAAAFAMAMAVGSALGVLLGLRPGLDR